MWEERWGAESTATSEEQVLGRGGGVGRSPGLISGRPAAWDPALNLILAQPLIALA